MPILVLTDRFDGRLTPGSMTVAFVLALFGAARLGRRIAATARAALPLLAAGTVAIVAFVAVNVAKFGSVNVPFEGWVAAKQAPLLQKLVDNNNGSFFNPRILPTALFTYLGRIRWTSWTAGPIWVSPIA